MRLDQGRSELSVAIADAIMELMNEEDCDKCFKSKPRYWADGLYWDDMRLFPLETLGSILNEIHQMDSTSLCLEEIRDCRELTIANLTRTRQELFEDLPDYFQLVSSK
jgi:hypothetical protein